METNDVGSSTVPRDQGTGQRLRAMDRLHITLPAEVNLPLSERVYALDAEILDDPLCPTPRDCALIERLGALMCEAQEVIAITALTKEQFNSVFAPIWARGRERAKARLRLMQWDAAAMGSERMLVHLGKQYLDQTEKTESNTLDEQQRRDKQAMRDKLADAINRAGERRLTVVNERGRSPGGEEGVGTVGTGQPAPPSP